MDTMVLGYKSLLNVVGPCAWVGPVVYESGLAIDTVKRGICRVSSIHKHIGTILYLYYLSKNTLEHIPPVVPFG